MTGWVVATETIRPLPVARTPTRACQESLYTLIALAGKRGKGSFAKVGLEDFEFLTRFTWWMHDGYAVTTFYSDGKKRYSSMHRMVAVRKDLSTELFSKFLTDHENRNRLDNRRKNIRLATRLQNARNGVKPMGTVPYIGVYYTEGRGYIAHVTSGQRFVIEKFETAEEAARVRDALARFYHGEFAVTNFEGIEAYDIKTARRLKRSKQKRLSLYSCVGYLPKRQNRKKPWTASVTIAGKSLWLGCFPTEEAAARAVDDARVAHGLARVNFPD